MSSKRTMFTKTAIVAGLLAAAMGAASAAHAVPIQAAIQAAVQGDTQIADPRANVKIESKILVERTEQDAAGNAVIKLYSPSEVKVIPGDKLVFINSYRNTGDTAVTGFVVNNPVHSAVAFTGVQEDWAMVSVDGGKNFGELTGLTMTETTEEGAEAESVTVSRAAQPGDVTHIRWAFDQAIAAGASGELRFSGVVK